MGGQNGTDLVSELKLIAQQLADMISFLATTESRGAAVRVVEEHDRAAIAAEIGADPLTTRLIALRGCCEAALKCVDNDPQLARTKVRAAVEMVEAWNTVEKRVQSAQRGRNR
jgi:hypothetical protein